MKTNLPLSLFRWLAVAALFDWFITRTITRAAIFVPKPPPVILIYRTLNVAGQLALTLAGLLALGVLGWIAWHEWYNRRRVGLALALVGQMLLNLLFLFVPPAGWLAFANHLLYLVAIGLLGFPALQFQPQAGDEEPVAGSRWRVCTLAPCPRVPFGRLALLLPALALIAGRLHQAIPALFAALHWPGPPALTGLLFNWGELLVVLSPLALWWGYGRGASWRTWLIAALPVLIFTAGYLANAAMTGILAVWSMGLTLYLPWPLYAVSLWLAGVTVVVALRRGAAAGWAVLLLITGGYAPQLSLQAFLGLIALWLLADPALLASAWRGASAVPARHISGDHRRMGDALSEI
jgi:hypothetical protein